MLTARELADMQATATTSMVTPCQVLRAQTTETPAGVVTIWQIVRQTVCRLAPARRQHEEEAIAGVPLWPASRWTVSLPAGTPVTERDRLQIAGAEYDVFRVEGPRTNELTRRVECIRVSRTNVTVRVLRGVTDPATRQTRAPATVVGLEAVPVFLQEVGTALRAQGMAPEYDLMMLWDPQYDIRDGDQIAGYNPGNASVPPVMIVQHAATERIGTSLASRVCMLRALKPAGGST